MIITCPSCGARYKVRDDLIPVTGKRVKCKKCAALFRAFPDKMAILEKPSPKRAIPPLVQPISTQATIMVDQAKLSNYLQQTANKTTTENHANAAATRAALVGNDPKKPSHATVQIDRTKIDAFLQNKVSKAGGDFEPNTTLEVSREELDSFLKKPKPGGKSGPLVMPRAKIDPEKFQDLQRALGATSPKPPQDHKTVALPPQIKLAQSKRPMPLFEDQKPPSEAADDKPDDAAVDFQPPKEELDLTVPSRFAEAQNTETTPPGGDGSEDGLWTEPPQAPNFPSDEELGLTAEPDGEMLADEAMPTSVSFDDTSSDESDDLLSADTPTSNESDDFLADQPRKSADAVEDTSPSATAKLSEPSNEVTATVTDGEASGELVALFTVKVEDTEYPNKSLEALDRWIHEGRLLETDLVAESGSTSFKKAYDVSEIAAIFDRYFGQNSTMGTSKDVSKKGFFAKLFSIFGKKS